jgi:hypothetical protein
MRRTHIIERERTADSRYMCGSRYDSCYDTCYYRLLLRPFNEAVKTARPLGDNI